MRLALAFMAMLLVAGVAQAETSRNWIVVAGPDGSYFADFPGQPKLEQSVDGERNGKPLLSYVLGIEIDNRATFYGMVSTDMGDAPKNNADRDRILENVRRSIVASSADNKLVASVPVAINGVDGLDFVFEVPAHKVRIRHRLFLVGTRLVQQMASGKPGIETSPDTIRFMNSLRLKQ